MSYSDDLDWLARNVHTWPKCIIDGEHRETLLWIEPSKGDVKAAFSSNPLHCFNRDQWLARRAELQMKYESHPFKGLDEAIRKVISVMRSEPEAFTPRELSEMRDICAAELAKIDTIEKRPADMHKTTPEIDTSAERVQETAKSMRDWHERGELPPVGAFVDVTGVVVYGDGEKGCEVIAHVENCAVIRMSWGLGCFVAGALSPHRTERDAAVEAMKALCPYKGSWETTYRLFAESLYDAGYRAGGFYEP